LGEVKRNGQVKGLSMFPPFRILPEVIDVYEVTGEYDLIATAKANDSHRLKCLISLRS